MKRNFKYLAFILALVVAGCGSDKQYKKKEQAFTQAISAGGAPLPDEELAVALRICYALRSKHTTFKAEQVGKAFRFNVKETFCDGRNEEEFINTVVNDMGFDQPLEYSSTNTRPYFKKIMTNVYGPLKGLCEEVLKGNTPANVVNLGPDEVMEVSFENGVYDTFELRYGRKVKPLDVTYTPYKVETFKVLTNSRSSGNLLGLVSESERRQPCTDSLNERLTHQIYTP